MHEKQTIKKSITILCLMACAAAAQEDSMAFKRCLNLTNSLTLAEAQAKGIDIKLREVLTLEIEADPQWGPTPVIRRRWVLSSEPFGEKIPGPATTW